MLNCIIYGKLYQVLSIMIVPIVYNKTYLYGYVEFNFASL